MVVLTSTRSPNSQRIADSMFSAYNEEVFPSGIIPITFGATKVFSPVSLRATNPHRNPTGTQPETQTRTRTYTRNRIPNPNPNPNPKPTFQQTKGFPLL